MRAKTVTHAGWGQAFRCLDGNAPLCRFCWWILVKVRDLVSICHVTCLSLADVTVKLSIIAFVLTPNNRPTSHVLFSSPQNTGRQPHCLALQRTKQRSFSVFLVILNPSPVSQTDPEAVQGLSNLSMRASCSSREPILTTTLFTFPF